MSIAQISTQIWKLNSWGCICDYCGKTSKKLGPEPGDAAEFARKEGFTTVSIGTHLPMKWQCLACGITRQKNGKSNISGIYKQPGSSNSKKEVFNA